MASPSGGRVPSGLRRQWERRLKASGFVDIEWRNRGGEPGPYLRGPNWHASTQTHHPDYAGKGAHRGAVARQAHVQEYYRLAGWWLHDADWSAEPPWASAAWELVAQGRYATEVHRTLRRRYRHVSLGAVRRLIRDQERRMREAYT